jgi:methyltransferase (TIGR00027 family)
MSTARGVALVRAIETARPEARRIISDPYAKAFVNPITMVATALMHRSRLLDLLLPPGMIDFAIARDRYVYDLMVSEVANGLDQMIILGAGFDTRAYRIPGIGNVPVFEIDHPATQRAKRAALRGVVEPLPANVKFVPVDFETDSLGEQLATAGYNEHERSLFVWQGVTPYLTDAGVDRTLEFVARHSSAGSRIVFDYFDRDILEGGRSAWMRLMTAMMGEKLSFGIPAAGVRAFLETRGFTGVRNIDGVGLRRLYWTGREADRPLAKGAEIVIADVAAR